MKNVRKPAKANVASEFYRRFKKQMLNMHTEHRGMKISIPTMPIRLPPRVTAVSTQMEGRPTEDPTTWG